MMTRFEALLVHLSTFLVGGTGLVYAWFRYVTKPEDPYAVVNHPLQPAVQHAHVLCAPLLVFAAALIWRRHVADRWRQSRSDRRRSGRSLALGFAPLVASGYLLQVATDEPWRRAWVVLHLVSGGLWLAAYAAHQLTPRRARAAAVAAGEVRIARIPVRRDE